MNLQTANAVGTLGIFLIGIACGGILMMIQRGAHEIIPASIMIISIFILGGIGYMLSVPIGLKHGSAIDNKLKS